MRTLFISLILLFVSSIPLNAQATGGVVRGVGRNSSGQVGDGTVTDRTTLTQVATNVTYTFANYNPNDYTLFVHADGTLSGCGKNDEGLLGGPESLVLTPKVIDLNVVAAEGGRRYIIYTKADGTLWGMGDSGEGQIGPRFSAYKTPVLIERGIAIGRNKIAALSSATAYIKLDGSLWIRGAHGLILNGSSGPEPAKISDGVVAVMTGSSTFGGGRILFIKTDGTLWGAGLNNDGELVGSESFVRIPKQIDTGVVSASTSADATVYRKADGSLWGMGTAGSIGLSTTAGNRSQPIRSPVQIASGAVAEWCVGGRTFYSRADGTLWATGSNFGGVLGVPTNTAFITGFAQVASGIMSVSSSGAHTHFVSGVPPVITAQPVGAVVAIGNSASLSVEASGAGIIYQWRKDGIPIVGATSALLTISTTALADSGRYSVTVTNFQGSATSESATLSVVPVSAVGRVVNLSILTELSGGTDSFTLGFVVGGAGTSGSKPILIRAAGPSLVPLGVTDAATDPKLEVYSGITRIGENDNWGGTAELVRTIGAVGAFPYTGVTSLDAAVLTTTTSGDKSVRVLLNGSSGGTVIAELYDASDSSTITSTTPKILNVSVLKNIGSGLTAGFVIGGQTPKTVLVRAVGPTLGSPPFNVQGVISDPQMVLGGGATVLSNDNWNGDPVLTAAFQKVGAFGLPAASKDAVLLATLAPGSYTVRVTGVGTATGVALIEVYEVP